MAFMSTKIGEVTHYYPNISVGTIKLSNPLKVGDNLKFEGNKTDFSQPVSEMQYNHVNIEEAEIGKEVGVKVKEKVRKGDIVSIL